MEDLARSGTPVVLTTVYRNLPLMERAGIVRRTGYHDSRDGRTRYEHVWGQEHHDHLVCSRCGRRVEFHYPAIEILQDAVARDHGFVLERHHMELIGICSECRE